MHTETSSRSRFYACSLKMPAHKNGHRQIEGCRRERVTAWVRDARNLDELSNFRGAGSVDVVFYCTRQNSSTAEAITSCSAAIRSFKRSSTQKAKVEISTTSVIDPNAVKSTVVTVSQGARVFARPIRIVRSKPDTSCSNNSEVSFMKKAKASAVAPNHRENFMAPDENEAGLGWMPHSTLHLRACRNTGENKFFRCLNLVPALCLSLSRLEINFFATYRS
jgi:hypothetical protein